MTLEELCEKLKLPQEVTEKVLRCEPAPEEPLRMLTCSDTAEEAWNTLHREGIPDLANQLRAALLTYEKYKALGLPDAVFFDTMGCFPRFLGENLTSFGCYDFDRGYWTWRQLSLRLFRVGELEYERREGGTVSMHIPSGADLSLEKCRESAERFQALRPVIFPGTGDEIRLRTWLLSPALAELLPENSRIVRFARCFDIAEWDPESTEFLQWVFGRRSVPTEELPENTTLRRNMKAYLLRGGKVGVARGTLRGFQL